jgi:hypothetical protein
MNPFAPPPVLLLATVAVAQWSTPVPMANLNSTTSETAVQPTADGLTVYFTRGYIFTATRTTRYGAFGPPTPVMELGAGLGPCPRADNLEIFFVRGASPNNLDLWRADRPTTSVPWNPPVPLSELNTTKFEIGPTLTGDGLRIYFCREPGNYDYDIWTATRPNLTSPFGPPTLVTELNTTSREGGPCVSPEGLVIFFESYRPGGLGGFDIWMASRLDTASPFGNIVNVTALNSARDDRNPGFGSFHDEVFFDSVRPGGLGGADLYTSRFTGLVSAGIAGVSSNMDLRFSDPPSGGRIYVAASSLGTSPGIRIDTRILPLNFDPLMQVSIGGLPPVLTGYVGTLDQDGVAFGRISFAGLPHMVGFRFFTAFVVVDPAAPSGTKTISNPLEVLVQ